jgi:hypothetical protein
MAESATKLDGVQRDVLARIASGASVYGRHNEHCRGLRKLGLVTMQMHPSSSPGCPDQPHWFLTEAGRVAYGELTPPDSKRENGT